MFLCLSLIIEYLALALSLLLIDLPSLATTHPFFLHQRIADGSELGKPLHSIGAVGRHVLHHALEAGEEEETEVYAAKSEEGKGKGSIQEEDGGRGGGGGGDSQDSGRSK